MTLFLAVTIAGCSSSPTNPLKVVRYKRHFTLGFAFTMYDLKIQSKEKKITLLGIKVNDGNCTVTHNHLAVENGQIEEVPIFPRVLRYGQIATIVVQTGCKPIKAAIKTNYGTYDYTW